MPRSAASSIAPFSAPAIAPSRAASAAPRRAAATHLLDYVIPAVILLAVLVVLTPVPPAVLDLMLAANLTVSVLALLGALAARTPLDMSVFPTFLLGSTLIRLVLNIASTRLVLSRAAVEGVDAAGQVVQAFGEFVAANNIVVGGVIFAIIAVIQFVVITAGSTRTSEVAARFTLDGLPGRQMAIDAEVQAGTVTREEARRLRLDLQRQADFFASMDGASRFVRGEAVAGVVITLVNLVGGLAIGVIQHGMPFAKAVDVYSRLTIGDGLVSAVPALLVSVATGLLISRSSQSVDLPRELGRQFVSRPHVLAITAVFLGLLSFTGLPFLPLAGMAVAAATAAWLTRGAARRQAAAETAAARVPSAAAARPKAADDLLADDRIVVEVGRGLVSLITGPLPERTAAVRSAVAVDLGLVVPQVVMRDDLALGDRCYRVTIAGEAVFEAEIPAGRLLAVPAPGEVLEGVDATPGAAPEASVIEPLTGRRGTWLGHAQADTARRRGATVFDEADCVARAVEAAVRRHADRLLSRDAVARLVESLRETQPAVVEQAVPGVLTIARIHRTLQCLLRDGAAIRPFAELLEIMTDHAGEAPEPAALAEIVRRSLVRSICRRVRDPEGRLVAVRLEQPAIDAFVRGSGPAPQQLVAELRRAVRPVVERAGRPVVVVPGGVRTRIRDALARHLPDVRVLAAEELADEERVEVFATVGGTARAA
jgi:flagellar biosynthesis protein FlhA